LGSVARDVARRIRGLPLPPGVRLEVGGQVEGQQQTVLGMLRVAGLSLVAVAAVLLIQFRRARLAGVVLVSVPFALVGAVAVLSALGVPLNASSLMGCVLLVGLVVKNGILLLERYEAGLAEGKSVDAALVEAGRARVRPIAMTTLATIAGLLPLALGFGAGAELQRPLAVAVIGGLALSTVVTIVLVPALVWVSASDGGA
jgi:multidrug efflux pump subunit AcrB